MSLVQSEWPDVTVDASKWTSIHPEAFASTYRRSHFAVARAPQEVLALPLRVWTAF